MLAGRRSVVFWVLISFIVIGASIKNKKHGKNIGLLEYKQNINFGINNTRAFPILIIPVFTENSNSESIIINKFNENQTYTLQLLHKNNINMHENDIDVGFRQLVSSNKSTEGKTKIKVKLMENEVENITKLVNSTENFIEQNVIIENSQNKTAVIEPTASPEGFYPGSNNTNEYTDSISLTMTDLDNNLPAVTDNRWQNFTVTNLNFGNESTTKEPDSRTNRGPYSAAFYNNGMIDQISITTNSYTNEESPLLLPKNDRWRTFSQNTPYSANQFKPLAGLYYDGFLHKPLIMLPGYIPRNHYNLFK